ncbi:MAG: hypothetical protein PHT33_10610 [bacterium]|nr:hypothetical protein [bacterium]
MNRSEIRRIIGDLDIRRLRKPLEEAGFGPVPVVVGDLFATGCYFVKLGKKTLGHKLCYTALRAYSIEEDLIRRILSGVDEHPEEMTTLLNPHLEVPDWLFGNEEV